MTKEEIKAILDRVLKWPAERQEAAVEMLLWLESEKDGPCEPSDDERAAIAEGLEQARRGEFVSDEEIEALWKRYDP